MADASNDDHAEESPEAQPAVPAAEDDENQYKAPAVKTIEELASLDEGDESLRKWKESLGIYTGMSVKNPNDPRKLVPLRMKFSVGGVEKLSVDLTDADAVQKATSEVIEVEEGLNYEVVLHARVQNDNIFRLIYLEEVRPKGIRSILSEKSKTVIGSFTPRPEEYVWPVKSGTLPEGMAGRGKYKISSKLIDDDTTESDPHFACVLLINVVHKK